MMFGAIVPELRGEAEILGGKLARLSQIREDVEKEKASLNASIIDLKTSSIDLGQLIIQKKQLVFDSAGKLEGEKKKSREGTSKGLKADHYAMNHG